MQSVRQELTETEDHEDVSALESLIVGEHNRHKALPGASYHDGVWVWVGVGLGVVVGVGVHISIEKSFYCIPPSPDVKSSLPRASLMVRRFPGYAQGYAGGKRTETKFVPSRVCQQFMMRNFDEVCRLVLRYRTSKNSLVHQTLLALLPRIAALNQELFALK